MAFDNGGDWHIYDAAGRRKYLTEAEFVRFLSVANRYCTRRRALFYVLAYTGCRVSEALALTRYQLDTDARTLTLKTLKRRRLTLRIVPIPGMLVDMLASSAFGGAGPFWPVSRSTAWRWVKAAMRLADISGPMCSPKGLRHCFATRAIGKNISLPVICRWMGHAQLSTTAIYLHVVDEEERKLMSRLWEA